jgi:hypothetical protein
MSEQLWDNRTMKTTSNPEPRGERMSKTYRVDMDAMTVCMIDEHGEEHDLNADGAPIETHGELQDFVLTLGDQGAYDRQTEMDLYNSVY